jgi:hypothetical protein
MNIAWLLAENTLLPPGQDTQPMRDIAPIWGSWRTQRAYQTDNVVCWDADQAAVLIEQGYADVCNLYIPETVYETLHKPPRVNVFGGAFDFVVDSVDDIVAAHLSASVADVIIMVGFDLESKPNAKVSRNNYIGLLAQSIRDSGKQWVIVDHPKNLDEPIQKLSNITRDLLPNVLQLLNNNSD